MFLNLTSLSYWLLQCTESLLAHRRRLTWNEPNWTTNREQVVLRHSLLVCGPSAFIHTLSVVATADSRVVSLVICALEWHQVTAPCWPVSRCNRTSGDGIKEMNTYCACRLQSCSKKENCERPTFLLLCHLFKAKYLWWLVPQLEVKAFWRQISGTADVLSSPMWKQSFGLVMSQDRAIPSDSVLLYGVWMFLNYTSSSRAGKLIKNERGAKIITKRSIRFLFYLKS